MQAFDDFVAALDPAMVVVTVAGADGEVDGCLVGFHSQSSIGPRRYTVWLSTSNRTYRLAREATHLAVHRLAVDQHGLAERFGGQTADAVAKLPPGTWEAGPGGVPLLPEVADRFVGRVLAQLEGDGDHVAFVLEPVSAEIGDGSATSLRLRGVLDIDPGHEP
jgi:flavin reductase (DIM6/NTAB) family NADH-FMN oxidoreductase RutF